MVRRDPKNSLTGMFREFGVTLHTCINHYSKHTHTGALDTFSREWGRSRLLLSEEASFFYRQVQMIEQRIPLPASFLSSRRN